MIRTISKFLLRVRKIRYHKKDTIGKDKKHPFSNDVHGYRNGSCYYCVYDLVAKKYLRNSIYIGSNTQAVKKYS